MYKLKKYFKKNYHKRFRNISKEDFEVDNFT